MRKKSWLNYGIYIILLIVLIFLKEYLTGKLQFIYNRTWGAGVSYILLITAPFMFNIVVGLFLGIEHFIMEIKKAGKWNINLPKLILVGFPSLFFSLTYHVACINNAFLQSKLLSYVAFESNFIPVFQIVFGYVCITCMYKKYDILSDTE
jgi:hypothetical protein